MFSFLGMACATPLRLKLSQRHHCATILPLPTVPARLHAGNTGNMKKSASLLSIGFPIAVVAAIALQPDFSYATPHSTLQEWWNGKGLLQGEGNSLFDTRRSMQDHGFKLKRKYGGAFYGVLDSDRGFRGFWDQSIDFGAELDFGKITGAGLLDGVKSFGNFRWRDPSPQSNPNDFVRATSMFNPSHWQSGTQFRVMSFGMEISSEDHLPIEDMVVLRGGWIQPQKEFLQQPLSKLFLNNAIQSSKGVGGNIPFSSSYSSWGGTLNVKLHDKVYVKNGLFMAFPRATSSANHGLAYEGFAADPSRNGLLYMGELGFKPEFGEAKLDGHYAFGGYYFGTPTGQTRNWSGGTAEGRYAFYFQADQMIFREPSAPTRSAASDGKSFKEVVEPAAPKLSKQGLIMFNMVTFAPGNYVQNTFPLLPQRPCLHGPHSHPRQGHNPDRLRPRGL
jgi:porin